MSGDGYETMKDEKTGTTVVSPHENMLRARMAVQLAQARERANRRKNHGDDPRVHFERRKRKRHMQKLSRQINRRNRK